MDAYSLGQLLREAREANEIEIEDVVAKLRIRQPILEAFEAGEFEIAGMPEIQVRGMLRIYARFLVLDEVHVLLLFDQMRFALEKGRRGRRGRRRRQAEAEEERNLSSTQPMQEMHLAERRASGCNRLIRLLLILLFSAAAIAIIIFVTVELAGIEIGEAPASVADATAPPPSATTAPSATHTEVAREPTASNRAQYRGSGILVSILLTQRSWVQVQVDGVEQFSGIATPETLLEYNAIGEVSLSASNAMALDVIWNGQQQGQVGGRGQRADIRFTDAEVAVDLGPDGAPTPVSPTAEAIAAEGVTAEPTATEGPSPTPTETLIPSETPVPTETFTPLPTSTPIPSATPTAGTTDGDIAAAGDAGGVAADEGRGRDDDEDAGQLKM